MVIGTNSKLTLPDAYDPGPAKMMEAISGGLSNSGRGLMAVAVDTSSSL